MIHPDSVKAWEAESNTLRGIIKEQRGEIERLRAGLRRLSEQNYDAGYTPEDYALAVLNGHSEPAAP